MGIHGDGEVARVAQRLRFAARIVKRKAVEVLAYVPYFFRLGQSQFGSPFALTKWAIPGGVYTIQMMSMFLYDIRFFNSIVRDIVIDKYQSENRIPPNLRILERNRTLGGVARCSSVFVYSLALLHAFFLSLRSPYAHKLSRASSPGR